tara:strand:- start:6131 stop:7174 length:1044 start_codon:yes stop_codon:yes gene_type:complete
MAEKKQLDKRIGGFGNITSPGMMYGRGLPQTAQQQTGPYEMGAWQTDAFGRKYPTPTMTDSTSGIFPPYQGGSQSTMNNGHQQHTGQEHDAVRPPPPMRNENYDENIPKPSSPGLIDYSEYGPFTEGYETGRPSDVLNYRQAQPYDQSMNAQVEGGSQGFDKGFRGLDPGEAINEPGALVRPEIGKYAPTRPQDREYFDQAASPGLGFEDLQGYASRGGLNVADALGKGVKGTAKYGGSLLNAALYGKDSDRTIGQDLKKGGGFLQKLLFGTRPAQEGQGEGAPNNFQMTPEQQAMRDKGMAQNPWLAEEDNEGWFDEQEYGPATPGGNVATRKFNRPTSYYGIGTN